MTTFTFVFIAAVVIHVTVEWWLCRRHIVYVRAHRDTVPEAFAAAVPLTAHQKAADYTAARTRFGQLELIYDALVLLAWTVGGGLDLVDSAWRRLELGPLATGVGFLLSVFALMAVLDIPTTGYRTFVVEQRFGFNRVTPRLFIIDLLKEGLLLLLFGTPLAALVLWIMGGTGSLWWLYVWVAWVGFSLLMMWAYPAFIAPLFNTFTPLTNEPLRQRIERLLSRNGFSSNGIFVMDGSLRSSHGNAYFTGFGNHKRIVFFDTLLKELEPQEIESVLAHELGHFKCRHVLKRLVLMSSLSLAGLALLGGLIDAPWLYHGLGVSEPSTQVAIVLFLMLTPIFGFLLQPGLAAISRKYEFEADAYASGQADAQSLIKALVKLYKDNASTLTPDPLYSAFHDSHPPAPLRVAHLSERPVTN